MSDFEGLASPTNITWKGNTGVVEYGGGDRGQVAIFYNRPMPDASKSRETGRPYYIDKVFVRVHPPGERLNSVDREAIASDKQRCPVQWQQYQQNKQQQPEGTPSDLLYPEHPSIGAMI